MEFVSRFTAEKEYPLAQRALLVETGTHNREISSDIAARVDRVAIASDAAAETGLTQLKDALATRPDFVVIQHVVIQHMDTDVSRETLDAIVHAARGKSKVLVLESRDMTQDRTFLPRFMPAGAEVTEGAVFRRNDPGNSLRAMPADVMLADPPAEINTLYTLKDSPDERRDDLSAALRQHMGRELSRGIY